MTTWAGFELAAPELAADIQRRFDATGLGLIATIRADGSPRICGEEPLIHDGELWLGMMPDSRKSLDLRRDPRFALHAATVDKAVAEGDAKVSGRAVLVDDPEGIEAFRAAFEAHAGAPIPEGPIDLWRAELTDASFLRPAGDHLVITIWTEAGGVRSVDRY